MIYPELKYDLNALAKAMREYGAISGKTEDEVLSKQSAKLAWNIYGGLRALKPGKGTIRAEQTAALKSGRGVHVRSAVLADVAGRFGALSSIASRSTYLNVRRGRRVAAMATEIENKAGRRMNLQALAVERELNIRESARGFSSLAVPRPSRSFESEEGVRENFAVFDRDSRYGFKLSDFTMRLGVEHKQVILRWIGRANEGYVSAVEGLSKPKQQKVVDDAVKQTTADIMTYVDRKQKEALRKAGLN